MHLRITTSSFIDWSVLIPIQGKWFVHYSQYLVITLNYAIINYDQGQATVLTACVICINNNNHVSQKTIVNLVSLHFMLTYHSSQTRYLSHLST